MALWKVTTKRMQVFVNEVEADSKEEARAKGDAEACDQCACDDYAYETTAKEIK